jgi:prepilin-type N-terminal cleavage/methylation domain-containing protein
MFTNDANGPDCWKCSINVEWHDCSFCPVIELRRGILKRNGSPAKPSPSPSVLPNPVRRKNFFKPMKKIVFTRRSRSGFTLIELLVVIAIIGILAAMLMTVFPAAIKRAKVLKAKTEMQGIVAAIGQYDQDNGRFPMTKEEQKAAGVYDFTTGFVQYPQAPQTTLQWPAPAYSYDNNSNIVAILTDSLTFPVSGQTCNTNHQYNPKQIKYLNAKMSGYNPTSPQQNPPGGVDDTGVYRDPWGNPYVMTMNASFSMDGAPAPGYSAQGTSDIFYCLQNVSQQNSQAGFNGLMNATDANGGGNHFLFHGKVMVWSAGPDGKVDPNKAANADVNKDNILSWQ